MPRHILEGTGDLRDDLSEGGAQGHLSCDEAEADAITREFASGPPVGLAKAPPRAVPRRTAPEPPARDERDRAGTRCAEPEEHERGALDSRPAPEQPLEVPACPQPLSPWEPLPRREGLGRPPSYTLSRRRPLARRRLSTFRPPFVAMR